VFTRHSWAEWTFLRDTQLARLARRVALVQVCRPYLPGASHEVLASLPTPASEGGHGLLRLGRPECDGHGDTPQTALIWSRGRSRLITLTGRGQKAPVMHAGDEWRPH